MFSCRLKKTQEKYAALGINFDLTEGTYKKPVEAKTKGKKGPAAEVSVVLPTKKEKKAAKAAAAPVPKTAKVVKANNKPAANKPAAAKGQNNDDTLNKLLNNTINSSDEEDDDYEPTAAEVAEADQYIKNLLGKLTYLIWIIVYLLVLRNNSAEAKQSQPFRSLKEMYVRFLQHLSYRFEFR